LTFVTFEKHIVKCGESLVAEIKQEGDGEHILELATDWKYGMGLPKEDVTVKETGFLGAGFNKIAIYVGYFAGLSCSPFRCLTFVTARPDIVKRNMLFPAFVKIQPTSPVFRDTISQRSSSFLPLRTP
jgi:hypothetical protein